MDDFSKFQLHQTADDKVVITFGLLFRIFFNTLLGPFNNAFVVSFKLQFFKLNVLCLVDKRLGFNLHIKKNINVIIIHSFLQLYLSILLDIYA